VPICMPEKIILATLQSGLAGIIANLSILTDVFDTDVVDANYIPMVTQYIQNNPVKISYGYPSEELQAVGWYLLPSNNSAADTFIGNLVDSEVDTVNDQFDEYNGIWVNHSTRILTSSPNMDVTLFMDAIGRYIILSAKEALSSLGIEELVIQGMDIDPLFQYLPQNLYHKVQVVGCKALDTWMTAVPLFTGGITLSMNIGGEVVLTAAD